MKQSIKATKRVRKVPQSGPNWKRVDAAIKKLRMAEAKWRANRKRLEREKPQPNVVAHVVKETLRLNNKIRNSPVTLLYAHGR